MKLVVVFIGTFVGFLALILAVRVAIRFMGRLVQWLVVRTKRKETDVVIGVYLPFIATLIASTVTAVVASGGATE